MLRTSYPRVVHFLQNAALVLLSLSFFIPNLYALASCYVLQILGPRTKRQRARRVPGFQPQRILVTGVGMAKGLAIARMFYLAGHDVVGADYETYHIPVNGRFSRSLRRFYSLPLPGKAENIPKRDRLKEKMLNIVRNEKITLWVSCSVAATAIEDARVMETLSSQTSCRCIQLNEKMTTTLDGKGSLNDFLKDLKLPAPEGYVVRSRHEVHKILSARASASKKTYVLKRTESDRVSRPDLTRLPRRTLSETYNHVAGIPITSERPHLLQEFVPGSKYSTHALIISNTVHSFVACRNSEHLMHYEPLKSSTPLHDAMLKFTQEFAHRSKQDLTGHVSFDFIVAEHSSETGVTSHLYPIQCSPRARTAVTLFQNSEKALARKYLAAPPNAGTANGVADVDEEPVLPENSKNVYWIGHDLITLVILPILSILTFKTGPLTVLRNLKTFLVHLIFWKDGTFEIWDPLPFFWLYHMSLPAHCAMSILFGRKLEKVDVTSSKIIAVK